MAQLTQDNTAIFIKRLGNLYSTDTHRLFTWDELQEYVANTKCNIVICTINDILDIKKQLPES